MMKIDSDELFDSLQKRIITGYTQSERETTIRNASWLKNLHFIFVLLPFLFLCSLFFFL
jgi:hypothetical protein